MFTTGVGVYQFVRSPKNNNIRSPWALKKVMNREFQEEGYGKMIQYEANVLKSLSHTNIVGFRGFTTTEDGREVSNLMYFVFRTTNYFVIFSLQTHSKKKCI